MKKILFPTEFSLHAPHMFKYALELAYFFNARLILMHAFNQPEVKLYPKEDLEKMASETNARLEKLAKENLIDHCKDVQIEFVVRSGMASTEILQVALEEEVDLMVLGKTGKTNAFDTIFGSTAMEILAKSDCPLLLVPSNARFEGVDNIVFTTSFEFGDLYGINFLKKWGRVFDASIRCLHVIDNEKNTMEALMNMSILKKTFSRSKRLSFELVAGDVEDEVEKFARKKRVDIVAMVTHKRNLLSRLIDKSTSKQVAQKIQLPLLVIKENSYEIESFSSDWLALANSIA